MTVAAILKQKGHDVAAVRPSDSVAVVVRVLADRRIGAVPVLTEYGDLAGILSERDVVRSLVLHGAATLDMRAEQLMTRSLRTASPATTVPEAMAMMTTGRFRHLPVLDDGRMVGIVSIGDVVASRLRDQEDEVNSLKAYVAGAA